MIRLLLATAASYGFRVSLTATRNIREVAEAARRGDRAAQAHFTQTRYARVFGVRNSDLGVLYYGAVFIAAATGLIRRRPILTALRAASIASALTSLYLLWALTFRLHVRCRICLKGHAVNFALLVLLMRQQDGA